MPLVKVRVILSLYVNPKHPKSKKKLDVMRKCMEEKMNITFIIFLWLLKKKKNLRIEKHQM